MDHQEKKYKPSEFAALIGVSVRTLQRWDVDGNLEAFRSPTDRRYYTYAQYLNYIEKGKKKSVTDYVISRDEVEKILYSMESDENKVAHLKKYMESLFPKESDSNED